MPLLFVVAIVNLKSETFSTVFINNKIRSYALYDKKILHDTSDIIEMCKTTGLMILMNKKF